jgi:threonine/homoserine/homoserine lactone efflux protein
MTILSVLSLLVALFVLAIVPGPGVIAVTTSSLSKGFTTGALTSLGILLGDAFFILISAFTVKFAVTNIEVLFYIVKYLGGGYLIWLGFNGIRSSNKLTPPDEIKISKKLGNQSIFTGLIITLGNPKIIVFYIGLLPAFINLSNATALDLTIIIFVDVIAVGSVLLSYAWLASKASVHFTNNKVISAVEKMAGFLLMILGLIIIATSN